MSECANTIARMVAVMSMLAGGQPACAEMIWRQLPPLPDARGFASPFAGVSHDALVVAGGANFPDKPLWEGGAKKWHDTIFVLRDENGGWQSAGRLEEPRAYGVSVTTEQGLFCAGGSDEKRHSDEVFLLKWEDGRIVREELPPLPRPAAMAAGAVMGNRVYVAGGLESPESVEASTAFWAFDLDQPSDGWKSLPSWPGPGRFQAVAAGCEEEFYLFSGIHKVKSAKGIETAYLRDAYRYTEAAGWEKLPDLPVPAAAAASPAPVDQGRIYLIGGVDGSGNGRTPRDFFHVPQRVQCYSRSENSWGPAGNAPVGRVCVPTAPWRNSWILVSGERSPGVRSPEVWSVRTME